MTKWLRAAAAALLVGLAAPAQAVTLEYADFFYDPAYTPDALALIGNGVNLGGAQFSSGTATRITGSVAFQADSIGGGGVISP